MDELRKSGDSVGARINVVATGVPVGWGEPVYDRLDADIAYAMMSINAVKGVEIGAGFASVAQLGTQHNDDDPEGFLSNNAGGVVGGISSGQDVLVSIAIKPTASTRLDRRSINKAGEAVVRTPTAATILRRHPRHAHRRSHAGAGADGSRPAPSGPERRCRLRHAKIAGLAPEWQCVPSPLRKD
jgi:chorismate synthase